MDTKLGFKYFFKLYAWALSYFKPFLHLTLAYVLCGGVLIWGELMIPRQMGYLIDHVLPMKNMALLSKQLLILCGVVALILIAKACFNFLEVVLTNRITKNQQMDLILKLQTLGFSYYEKVPTGQILALFENAVKELQKTYTFLFPQFIYCFAQFIVPSIILIYNEPLFFWAAMVGNVIFIFLNQFANQNIQKYLSEETAAAQVSQQLIFDALSATTELKVTGSEDWILDKTSDAFNRYRIPRMKSIFWRHFRFTTVGLTLTISIVLFHWYGLDLVKSGNLLLGEFIGYSFMMGLVSRGFSVFFYIIPAQQHALNYGKDLYDFMHLKPDVSDSDNSAPVSIHHFDIEFNNVSFGYQKDQPLLHNLTFKIPAGKKTAIVGESGCGKSTLLKLIGRFYDVSDGEITLGGENIKHLGLKDLRHYLGYVFQDTYLFNMSIRENLLFGRPGASSAEIEAAAERASAHRFIIETENGYDTVVGERGVCLSGGQKQRLSIARMILQDPKVILLDEATSALDRETEIALKQSLDLYSEGKTVVAVAHRLSTIKDYDAIIVLESGRIVEQGNYQELLNQKGLFYRLVMRGVDHAN